MIPTSLTDDLLELLAEAAREIARLDGPENSVCRRLQALHQRLQPLSTTVGQLAHRVDVPPRDLLDAAIAAGVRIFWHEGKQFRTPSFLESYLALPRYGNPLPELEFDLTPAQAERLAAELEVEVERLWADSETPAGESGSSPRKPLRKFAASQSALPDETTGRQKTGG